MILLVYVIKDEELADELCGYIGWTEDTTRRLLMRALLSPPTTPVQINTVVQELGDRAEFPRNTAYEILKEFPLQPEHYLQLEDMLRFKAGNLRQNLIKLLLKQTPEALSGTVERLLADKLVDKRLGGMDILMQLKDQSEYKEITEKAKPILKNLPKASSKELILIEELTKATGGSTEGEVTYKRENGYGLIENKVEVVMPTFPLEPSFDIKNISH